MDNFDIVTREITHIRLILQPLAQRLAHLRAKQEAYLMENPTLDPTYGIKLGKEDAIESLKCIEDKFDNI